MANLARLRVSLTKNGYLKIATVLARHPRWEVLDNIYGVYPGVNLQRSQVANILGADAAGNPPEFWDEIRSKGNRAIEAFTFVAIIFSHIELIRLMRDSAQGDMKGHLHRPADKEKAFTNLVYAMACCRVCEYERAADDVPYDMRAVIYALRDSVDLVRQLLEFKLRKCGWRPPAQSGTDFFAECQTHNIHSVFAMDFQDFRAWLEGRLQIEAPEENYTGPHLPR